MTDGPRHRAPSRAERSGAARRQRVLEARAVRGAAVHRSVRVEAPVPDRAAPVEREERPLSALRRIGRALGMAGGGAAVVGALAIGLFPTQTFLEQRANTADAQERLDVLRAQNDAFEDRIERLGTNEEIERLAREQYNLAYPGEETYVVLPAPLPPLELPELWPFGPMLDPEAASAEALAGAATPVP